MERTVALKKLERLLGKKLRYRIDPKAPTQDERDAAKAALADAVAERNNLQKQRDDRQQAILQADAEYQRLREAAKVASKRAGEIQSVIHRHKITVGETSGMFFIVKAEGDSWEEIIRKLTTKEPPKKPEPIPEADRKVASAMLKALNEGMRDVLKGGRS